MAELRPYSSVAQQCRLGSYRFLHRTLLTEEAMDTNQAETFLELETQNHARRGGS